MPSYGKREMLERVDEYGAPPLPYFADVLKKLSAGWPQRRIDELLPDRWQAVPATQ